MKNELYIDSIECLIPFFLFLKLGYILQGLRKGMNIICMFVICTGGKAVSYRIVTFVMINDETLVIR